MNLSLPRLFLASLLLVIETVFISQQITEIMFVGLLEISHEFSFKLNIFSYMILQCLKGSVGSCA